MKSSTAAVLLGALAHEARLNVFRRLVARGSLTAGDLAADLAMAPSTLSFHLKDLRHAGLIDGRRDGRQMIYTADLAALGALVAFLADDCCGGHPESCLPASVLSLCATETPAMTPPDKVFHVLFLCTGNSARSILAEAILNREGQGRFQAHSAGSHPRGMVEPAALAVLKQANYPTDGLRSKPWDEFAAPGAPELDFVFTVCDNAAGEVCPVWPGQPISAHWGVPDPVSATGSEVERQIAFADTFRMLYNRISIFTALPLGALDRLTLQRRLADIGKTREAGGE